MKIKILYFQIWEILYCRGFYKILVVEHNWMPSGWNLENHELLAFIYNSSYLHQEHRRKNLLQLRCINHLRNHYFSFYRVSSKSLRIINSKFFTSKVLTNPPAFLNKFYKHLKSKFLQDITWEKLQNFRLILSKILLFFFLWSKRDDRTKMVIT